MAETMMEFPFKRANCFQTQRLRATAEDHTNYRKVSCASLCWALRSASHEFYTLLSDFLALLKVLNRSGPSLVWLKCTALGRITQRCGMHKHTQNITCYMVGQPTEKQNYHPCLRRKELEAKQLASSHTGLTPGVQPKRIQFPVGQTTAKLL